jgi:Zn-dependent peptidase ImmA (M78 family)
MNQHRQYIEKLAQKALSKVDWKDLPVPVEEVARKFDIEVVPFAFHNKISGLLKKEEAIIGVNKTHHPVRRRFTVAHELGDTVSAEKRIRKSMLMMVLTCLRIKSEKRISLLQHY